MMIIFPSWAEKPMPWPNTNWSFRPRFCVRTRSHSFAQIRWCPPILWFRFGRGGNTILSCFARKGRPWSIVWGFRCSCRFFFRLGPLSLSCSWNLRLLVWLWPSWRYGQGEGFWLTLAFRSTRISRWELWIQVGRS